MHREQERIALPVSTSGTSRGPLLTVDPAVVVRYDGWVAGEVRWARIEFLCAQTVELRREQCLTDEDWISTNQMLCIRASPWLEEVIRRRRERLGPQFTDSDADFAHYQLYFDHHGVVEVVARSAVITGPFDTCPET